MNQDSLKFPPKTKFKNEFFQVYNDLYNNNNNNN
jgi:hypothetical protein